MTCILLPGLPVDISQGRGQVRLLDLVVEPSVVGNGQADESTLETLPAFLTSWLLRAPIALQLRDLVRKAG
jgi:hypothetical protein